MQSLVVLFALATVACGSYVPAQPAHHPALVLDPHGRPLDTAEVINARALHLQAKALDAHHAPLVHAVAPVTHTVVAPAVHVIAAPASAVSHQSRVDVHHSPAVVTSHVAPVVTAHVAPVVSHSASLWGHAAHEIAAHGHLLKKRSLGHFTYSAPIYAAPAAVSHQSRVDVVSSPAVVSHAIAAPVVAHAVAAPVVAHVAPSAVSHQSRVDVRHSPAVVTSHIAPVVTAHVAPVVAQSASLWGHAAHGIAAHGLYKRSLAHTWAAAHVVPAAVSHQERVDVISSPAVVSHAVAAPIVSYAAPVAVAHAVPAAVSHQSRVDVVSSGHVSPIAHSAVWTAPAAHWAHAAHW